MPQIKHIFITKATSGELWNCSLDKSVNLAVFEHVPSFHSRTLSLSLSLNLLSLHLYDPTPRTQSCVTHLSCFVLWLGVNGALTPLTSTPRCSHIYTSALARCQPAASLTLSLLPISDLVIHGMHVMFLLWQPWHKSQHSQGWHFLLYCTASLRCETRGGTQESERVEGVNSQGSFCRVAAINR